MSWREIVRQLHALHKIVNTADLMANVGMYADEAVRLNKRLLKAIGKNYSELPQSLIETCLNA
jgi:hypothetical protein